MTHRFTTLLAGGLMAAALMTAPAVADDKLSVIPAEMLEGLNASDAIDLDVVYLNEEADLSGYTKAYLEPVTFMVDESELDLTSSDEKQLAESLVKGITRGLPDTVEIVDRAGEGVMVLEFVITDATPNKDIIGVRASRPGLTSGNFRSVGVGGAATEAVITDGASGAVLAVLADDWQGRSFNANLNLHTRWGDARDAFRKFGRELGKLLD